VNVGIILCNRERRLFWARRVGQDAWQFPQGGVKKNETIEAAMYRELAEEVGLGTEHVEIIGATRRWLRYRLPPRYIRRHCQPLCIGQKQRWYMVRLVGREEDVHLNGADRPEFDNWRWVNYWEPLREVVFFKRDVYSRALSEFAPLLFPNGAPRVSCVNPRPRERSARR
jgi:putative (di)nucleoside polyphosphate hydrolase